MKTLFTTIVLLFVVFGARLTQAQQVTVALSIPGNPSHRLSDWQSNPNTVILTIINNSGTNLTGQLSAQLERNGEVVAHLKENAKPMLTLSPGMKQLSAAEILPMNAINFVGTTANTAQRSGVLPEGQYRLCVSIMVNVPSSNPPKVMNCGDCKDFQIVVKSPPVLTQPSNGSTVRNDQQVFNWMPASPSTQTMRYTMRVVAVYPGQTAQAALKGNETHHSMTTSATTAVVNTRNLIRGNSETTANRADTRSGTNELDVATTSRSIQFAWEVTALMNDGTQMTSDAASFTYELPGGRMLSDTDCNKYVLELEKINDALVDQCNDCDKLKQELEDAEQALALAKQNLEQAKSDQEAAQKEEDAAAKKAEASAKAFERALKNFTSMAKALGLTVHTYGPGQFGTVAKDGFATVGGSNGKGRGGVAVQGSNGAVVRAGDGFGRSKNGSSTFWAAFREINKKAADNEAAQEALAIAKQRNQDAKDRQAKAEADVADLEAKIADLKAKLDECNKKKKELEEKRQKLVELRKKCLEIIAKQQEAQHDIEEAERAIGGAGKSIGAAEDKIDNAQGEIDKRPGASGGSSLDSAKKGVEEARADSTEAARLLQEAKDKLKSGDADGASRSAEEAKKKADEARGEANEAQSDAQDAETTAKQTMTPEEKAQAEQTEKRRKSVQDSIADAQARDTEAEKIIQDRIANAIERWGIPDSVADCLIKNKEALEAFLKWIKDKNPKNVKSSDLEVISDILENIGEVASAVAEALATGKSVAVGLANGLASAGINIGAGFFYDWVKEAASSAAKRIADRRVIEVVTAQATGPFGVIEGAGLNGKSATSYFYFKDCHGNIQVFRISATYGLEYLGTTKR